MFTPTLPAPEKVTAPVLREQLKAAADYMSGLQGVDAEKRDDQWKTDLRSAVEFINQADPQLTALERSAPAPEPQGPTGNTHPQNVEHRSLGDSFVQHDDYQNAGNEGWGASRSVEMEMRGSLFAGNAQYREITSGTTPPDNGGVFLPQAQQPIAPRPRQMRLFLRDVLDVSETGLSTIPYIREVDAAALEYGASAVLEGAAKPEVAMSWELDEAPVRKIAAWVTVTSEIIDDAATLRGYIDGRLAYMLAVREEYEILNGDGSAPHLRGLLQYTSGNTQLQTHSGADHVAALGYAVGLVENVDGDADGIVMNPLDYWTMITTRQATDFDGDGTYGPSNAGAPYVSGPTGVWGLPVIRGRAITSGTAIVGSWGMGATLFDRMSTRIAVGNQHSDYFTTNKIAVLAEERVALAVHRPDFFVNVTLS